MRVAERLAYVTKTTKRSDLNRAVMELLIGIDLGTTKSTAIAVDADNGKVIAKSFVETRGRLNNPSMPGRSEWDATVVVACGITCLKELANQLGESARDVISIGVTGQQHGTVVVDAGRRPLTAFINWQDQRGNEPSGLVSPTGQPMTWVEVARERLGSDASMTTGCRLNTGFMATSLFWLAQQNLLPSAGTACFVADLFVAEITNTIPVVEPTNAGGAGVFDVARRTWSSELIERLGLPQSMFAEIQEATGRVGNLSHDVAHEFGFRAAVPVFPAIGDHQASFLGSVADRHSSILINVGTGAQVAVFTPGFEFATPIELRPFPIAGNLLSNVGLAGGWSYQILETFIRQIGKEVFGLVASDRIFDRITELAGESTAGSGGLQFTPTFSGTRSDPRQRGSLVGISPENFTPANLVRSLIEGMARGFRAAYDQIREVNGESKSKLIGAGNSLRENRLLAESVASEFGLTPQATAHREEAAFGAALVAGVGCGRFADLDEAGKLIDYA